MIKPSPSHYMKTKLFKNEDDLRKGSRCADVQLQLGCFGVKRFMPQCSDVTVEMFLAVCSVSALRGNLFSVCLVDVFPSC